MTKCPICGGADINCTWDPGEGPLTKPLPDPEAAIRRAALMEALAIARGNCRDTGGYYGQGWDDCARQIVEEIEALMEPKT